MHVPGGRMPGGIARRTATKLSLAAGAAVVALALLPGSLLAQVGGRWIVLVQGGAAGSMRGELRLIESGPSLTGTIWLEFRDAGPEPLARAQTGPGGTLEFVANAPEPVRFTGHLDGGELRGDIRGDGPPRTWSAARLPDSMEYYPSLPRFVLRAVVTGRRDSVISLPGAWMAAIASDTGARLATSYARAALAAGVPALGGDTLMREAALRMMGVLGREQVVGASIRTLDAIRSGIADPRLRARFDQLFRPRGTWQVDLHDVALARARLRMPSLNTAAAVAALRSVGWLPRDGEPDEGTRALALYRLFALQSTDSAAAAALSSQMRAAEPAAAQAASFLLDGYASAVGWYAEAMRFLLEARWLPGMPPTSIADAVRAAWDDQDSLPSIDARVFGYPQAVPRYGVPLALFDRLVRPDNWAGAEWLRRHGPGAVLTVLHRLKMDYGPAPAVVLSNETMRLASPGALAGEDANGFLEPRDAIEIDPGYMPLLAIGAAVHEWQHLLFQRRLLQRGGAGWGDIAEAAVAPDTTRGTAAIVLPAPDPYLAEGLAEWRTDRIIAPIARQFPLIALAEVEKRARLARARPNDPHALGYAMLVALSRVVTDDRQVTRMLLAAAADRRGAAAVATNPSVRRAWARFRSVAGKTVPAPGRRALVPEFTFTIEAGFPDVLRTRIVLP